MDRNDYGDHARPVPGREIHVVDCYRDIRSNGDDYSTVDVRVGVGRVRQACFDELR